MKRIREMLGIVMAGLVGMAVTWLVKDLPRVFGLAQHELGPLGDWIAGSTSVVLQAIVIYLLVQTYRGQMKELEEQRQLLKLANEESKRKRFEDGFYMLIGRYEEVVKGLVVPGNSEYRSRRVFPGIADECMSHVNYEGWNSSLQKFFETRDWWLGDWIRIVLMISKYVRESDQSPEEQFAYLKFFRGVLSPPESRTLLAYLVTKEKGKSDTARFLLKNDFFKYSFVSQETVFPMLDQIVLNLHGSRIYQHHKLRESEAY